MFSFTSGQRPPCHQRPVLRECISTRTLYFLSLALWDDYQFIPSFTQRSFSCLSPGLDPEAGRGCLTAYPAGDHRGIRSPEAPPRDRLARREGDGGEARAVFFEVQSRLKTRVWPRGSCGIALSTAGSSGAQPAGRFLVGSAAKGRVYYRCQTVACPTTCAWEERVALTGDSIIYYHLVS